MTEQIQFESMNELNVGHYMMIKSYPCKITEKTTSKTGKHGSAKAHVTGKDIFTDKKYEEIFGSAEKVQVPVVVRANYIVQFIEESSENPLFMNVYVLDGEHARDFPIQVNKSNDQDMEILTKINEILNDESLNECLIQVIQAMGKERITQCTVPKK